MKVTRYKAIRPEEFDHPQVQRLRKEIRQQGMSINKLSEASGISSSMIKKMFGGISSPTLWLYEQVAGAAGLALVPQRRKK